MSGSVAHPRISVTGRIDGLDGVRGFATLIVVFTHMGLLNRAGWVALQCFFVMSGFLISRVLLDLKLRHGARRYFGEFYTFRMLRIIPAYWLYLTLLAIGAWIFNRGFFGALSPQLPLLYAFIFNYSWAFTEPLKTPWIGHLWSMSVEEQFYLAWPLLLWLTPIRRLPWVAGGLVLAGPPLRWLIHRLWAPYAAGHNFDAASMVWVATPSHLDAFACGALLCFDGVRKRLAAIPNPVYAGLILAVIAAGMAWNYTFSGAPALRFLGFPATMPTGGQYVWGYSVMNFLTCILLSKVVETQFGHWLVCWYPIDRLGKTSYSFYLIHHGIILLCALYLTPPLMAWTGWPATAVTLIWLPFYLATVFAIGSFSYERWELPFLRLKKRLYPPEAPPHDALTAKAAP